MTTFIFILWSIQHGCTHAPTHTENSCIEGGRANLKIGFLHFQTILDKLKKAANFHLKNVLTSKKIHPWRKDEVIAENHCHTWAQLSISAYLIIITADNLGPHSDILTALLNELSVLMTSVGKIQMCNFASVQVQNVVCIVAIENFDMHWFNLQLLYALWQFHALMHCIPVKTIECTIIIDDFCKHYFNWQLRY